jgi:hypothetical protein
MPASFPLAPRRNPSNFVLNEKSKVDLVGSLDSAGRRKGGLHAIAISRMDMGGKILERDTFAYRHAPETVGMLIHGELVGVDIPRPKGDAGRFDSETQMFKVRLWGTSALASRRSIGGASGASFIFEAKSGVR